MLSVDFKKMLEEVWEYLEEHYLNIDLSRYDNLNLTPTATTLSVIVIGIAIGVFFASFYAFFQKNLGGIAVRSLLSEKAHSVEDAMTLEELSLSNNLFVRFSLKFFLAVKKTVACVPVEERDAKRAEREKKKKPSVFQDATSSSEALEMTKAELENLANETVRNEPNLLFKKRKTKLASVAFYIPNGLRYRAFFRFDKNGSSFFAAILTVIVSFFVLFLLLHFLPYIFQTIDNVVGSLKA